MQITVKELSLELPFEFLHITEFYGYEKINDHGNLKIKLLLPNEESTLQLIGKKWENKVFTVKNNSEIFFKGVPQTFDFFINNNYIELTLSLLSTSIKFDIVKNKRSFQDVNQTCSSILENIYIPGEQIISTKLFPKNQSFYLQYDETNWEFAKKLATSCGSFLLADSKGDAGRFWLGMKQGKEIKNEVYNIKTQIDILSMHSIQENYQQKIYYQNKFFVSLNNYEVGDYLFENGKKYIIIEKKFLLRNGNLEFEYKMSDSKYLETLPVKPFFQSKVALEGTVIEVKGNRMKVILEIDENQNSDDIMWLECSEEYRNIAYFMPEIGSTVKVAFLSEADRHPVIISNVRKEVKSYYNDMQDTETKIIQNVHGKRLKLARNDISLKGDGVSIYLTDNEHIMISSNSDINLAGNKNISLSSGKNVTITGRESLIARSSSCSIKLSTQVDLFGSKIQHTSSSSSKAIHKSFEGKKDNHSSKRKITVPQLMDKVSISNTFLNMVSVPDNQLIQKIQAQIPRVSSFKTNSNYSNMDNIEINLKNFNSSKEKTFRPIIKKEKGQLKKEHMPQVKLMVKNGRLGIDNILDEKEES